MSVEDVYREMTPKRFETQFLYVFRCGPYFKVGITANIEKRRLGFAVGNPFKLKLVMYRRVLGIHARFVESQVHKHLAAQRHYGEWFATTLPEIKEGARLALKAINQREKAILADWAKADERNARDRAKALEDADEAA